VGETLGNVEADDSRLQELFENLFRNAVEHGGDDVSVRIGTLDEASIDETGTDDTDTDDTGAGSALPTQRVSRDGFYVEDDGPGIPDDEREKVFEHGHTTAEEGSGLGLSIVSSIADAHGWTVTATESESGGARFEISTA